MLYANLEKAYNVLPERMCSEIRILKIGARELKIRTPGRLYGLLSSIQEMPAGKRIAGIALAMLLAAIAAVAVYTATPRPEYALTDRNYKEHALIKDLEGKYYSLQEIKELERNGNIVLNYSGEDELMYVYYSDEDNPIPGGHYADKAAIVEKARRSISIFFWGTMTLSLGSALVENCLLTGHKDSKNKGKRDVKHE